MTNIDPNTGLPELPEGYFWRVVERYPGSHDIQLRKRRRLGSKRVERNGIYVTVRETPREAILYAAKELLRKQHGSASLIQFQGDYPPKKLGATTDANS